MPAASISIEPGQEKAGTAPPTTTALYHHKCRKSAAFNEYTVLEQTQVAQQRSYESTVNRNRTNKINEAFRFCFDDSGFQIGYHIMLCFCGSTRGISAAQNHAHIPMFGKSSSDRLESLSAASTSRQEELDRICLKDLICKDIEVHAVHAVRGALSNNRNNHDSLL